MLFLKQSTASQSVLIGPFVDSSDGTTAETGLTIANTDIRLSKNGGNLAAKNSGGATHDEAGWYTITLDATDTNTVGRLQLHCKMTGALMVHAEYWVLEEAIYDALFGASATGLLPANMTQISGDSTAADNLEADYDGTGYNKSNSTIGTCTTNTDMRGTDSAYTGTPPTAGAIADAVLDEALSGHTTAGTLGKAVADTESDATAILEDTGTTLPASIAAVQATADAIETDTQNIQSRIPAALSNGAIDANIARVNDVAVTGDGQSGTEWGPS